MDYSYNPLKRVFGLPKTTIKYICTRATTIDKEEISPVLQLNEGHFCNPFHASQIVEHDMRLEHYFRVTQWQDIRKFLKKNLSEYYWHGYSECEKAYYVLKKMSQINNTTPYTKGYLSVFDEYVSDDNIIHAEEFFLTEEPWSVSLATKVRAERNRQPWMQYEPYRPEYFVSCCLVNMIENQKEMQNSHRF